MTPTTLRERFPRLIYARGHGYGVRGPDADQAGYDASAFWARGGLAHILTPPELDYPIGQRGAMGDRNGAMALAFGVAAALLKRERTGTGGSRRRLAARDGDVDAVVRRPRGARRDDAEAVTGRAAMPNPLVSVYRTKDGRHIQLVFLEADRYWADFCRVVGREDLLADPRFADIRVRAAEQRRVHGRARRAVRRAHVRGVEARARRPRRALGAGAVGHRAARRPAGRRQRLHRRRRGRRRSAYQLPNVPVQFDGAAGAAAPGARARRAHRDDPARARLRLGRDRRARATPGRSRDAERGVPSGAGAGRAVGALLDGGRRSTSSRLRPLLALRHALAAARRRLPALPDAPRRTSPSTPSAAAGSCGRGPWCGSRSCPASTATCPSSSSTSSSTTQRELRLIGRLLDGVDAPLRLGARVGRWRSRTSPRACRGPGLRAGGRHVSGALLGAQQGRDRRLRAEPGRAPRRRRPSVRWQSTPRGAPSPMRA